MSNITPLTRDQAEPAAAAAMDAVKKKLGKVPNLVATLAHAPAALDGYLQLSESLSKGRLSARQREAIAIAVAQENTCQYCLSAHALLGKAAGLTPQEIAQARDGSASSPLDAALVKTAQHIVRARGRLDDAALRAARGGGIDDELLLELVAHVALNILTNYTNHIAGTEIDFPVVPL